VSTQAGTSAPSGPFTAFRRPTLPGRAITVRRLRLFASRAVWWVASVGIVIVSWEALAALHLINTVILPPPHEVLGEISTQRDFLRPAVGVFRTGANFNATTAIAATLQRVFAGVSLAIVAAMVAGGLSFYFKPVGKLLLPLVTLLSPIAPIAWLPLALVAFGIGDPAAIFVVFISLFFILTLAVVNTMKNVDQLYINTARVLGANRWQLALHIILPGILPALLVILRMNFFGAWTAVLTAEVVGTNTGLGAIIITGRQMMNMRLMFLGMAMIGLVAFLIDRLFLEIQGRLLWWKPTARA
jgi:ABC-type nitrate/sulfonate/bicarbonate transport system permease component